MIFFTLVKWFPALPDLPAEEGETQAKTKPTGNQIPLLKLTVSQLVMAKSLISRC
jgi:hypothetical protein